MIKFIKKIIDACKEVTAMQTKEENEKDKRNLETIFIFFLSLTLLVFLGYFIGKYILIPLVPFFVLLLIVKWSHETIPAQTQVVPYPEINILSELLCSILSKHAETFEIVRPTNISDIMPTAYPIQQYVNGLIFYRFIVLQKPDNDNDLQNLKHSLNMFLAQQLSSGFCPNLQITYYKDAPYFQVIDLGKDYYHLGYICIDIMPICNDAAYSFLYNKTATENDSLKRNQVQTVPMDEEF